MASPQAEAWKRVQFVCGKACPQANRPNMEYILLPEYEQELLVACQAAVTSGVPTGKLLESIQNVYDQVDIPMSNGLSSLLMANADLNHDVGGQTLFHRLFKQPYPPRLGRPAAAHPHLQDITDSDDEADEIGLAELLAKRPTPNLRDSQGNTILHILILHTIQAEYFPDVSTAGAMHLMPGESMENWDQRAKYVEGAFKLLVDAGWSIHQPGINQLTPLALLEAARQLANQLVNSRQMSELVDDAHGDVSSDFGAAMAAVMAPMKLGRKSILQAFINLQAYCRDIQA